VRPTSQNPYPLYDQNLRFLLPYLWPDQKFDWHGWPKHKLWRAFVDGLIDNDEKVASSKKDTQFKTRVLKPYLIYNQNGQNRYPIYDPNGWKTLPLGASHYRYLYSPYKGVPPFRVIGHVTTCVTFWRSWCSFRCINGPINGSRSLFYALCKILKDKHQA